MKQNLKFRHLGFGLLLSTIFSCAEAPSKVKDNSLYSYLGSVEVVPLETRDECLLGNISRHNLYVSDSCIVVGDSRSNKILRFDGQGAFQYTIGNHGRAANEFHSLAFPVFLPYKGIYAPKADKRWVRYGFDGSYLGQIDGVKLDPTKEWTEQGAVIEQFAYGDSCIASYFSNTIGTVGELLGIYSADDGRLVRMYPNPNVKNARHPFVFNVGFARGITHRGVFYFWETPSDTIFDASGAHMVPHWILPKELRGKQELSNFVPFDSCLLVQRIQLKADQTPYMASYILSPDGKKYHRITDAIEEQLLGHTIVKQSDRVLVCVVPAAAYNTLPEDSPYRSASVHVADEDNPVLILCKFR